MDTRNLPSLTPEMCCVGLWIDHEKAHIVALRDGQVACTSLDSHVERRTKTTGGLRMPGRNYMNNATVSEKKRDRRYHDQLDKYYRNVLKALATADRLVILGPGAAKNEIASAAQSEPEIANRIVSVETAVPMSERQLIANIKAYFGKEAPRMS